MGEQNQLALLSDDLNVITAEINSYKSVAGQAIFEIGKRLKHVKENDITHGKWETWLSDVGLNKSTSRKMIQAYETFENQQSVAVLGVNKIFQLMSLPEEQREDVIENGILTNSGVKPVEEVTSREIAEYKKALKEAESLAEQAKRSEQIAIKRLEEAENKPPEVIEKVIERVVQDETAIQRLESQLHTLSSTLKQTEQAKKEIETKMQNEQRDAEAFRLMKKDLETLKDRRESIIQQIDNAGTIGKFVARVEESFEKDLAPVKYTRAIQELHESEAVMSALSGIVKRVEDWCKEIRGVMPQNDYIDAEVIEYE